VNSAKPNYNKINHKADKIKGILGMNVLLEISIDIIKTLGHLNLEINSILIHKKLKILYN
jgi:hypothetical protein